MYKITVPTVVTNGHFNKEKTLSELKRCGAQRIALALDRELDYTFSSPKNLELLKELISYYKQNGLEVLVWLGETLGHSGAKQTTPAKYGNIRSMEYGDSAPFCPLDERFKQDFCSWVKSVAECGAEMIMLDDDFRLTYRNKPACCCPRHMKRLEEELGEAVDEKDLPKLLFDSGKNKYRTAWLKVQGDSMAEFAAAMRQALDTVNPQARLGFCCVPSSYGGEGWYAPEMAKIMAGGTKPFMRTSGATYWAKGFGQLGKIMEIVRMQLAMCADSGIEVFTECDTYPRPRTYCPSAYAECYDMILRADSSADGILKYMLDYVADADYETGYIDAHVENRENYEVIERIFSDKKCVGVRPYTVPNLMESAQYNMNVADPLWELQEYNFLHPALNFASANCLPTAYDGNGVNILFGENARFISENELKNGSIIDIAAAKILMQRGIDVGIKGFAPLARKPQKGFTDLPSEYHIAEGVYTRLDALLLDEEVICDENARIISKYNYSDRSVNATFEYENADGMRFFVYTVNMWRARNSYSFFATYAGRRSLIKSLKWLGGELAAYADGNYPFLYTLTKQNDKELAIGLWNLFDDKIKNARIKITLPFDNVEFVNCSGHIENGAVVLDSTLYPYEFAGITCKCNK